MNQPMLEDLGPAPLPLRAPGHPTVVVHIPLAEWACLAPMVWFHPALAPTPEVERKSAAAAAAVAGGAITLGGYGLHHNTLNPLNIQCETGDT